MIRDSFWTDSYIEKLTPDEKLVFLYLLTNPLANIAGIYEVRAKRIGFEVGYDIEVIENILNRFVRDKKLLRFNDWVCLPNHIKNQSLNPSVIDGCRRIFNELPVEVGQAVTGWVQAGLLNLTLLNLTLLNVTENSEPVEVPKKTVKEKPEPSLSFLENLPTETITAFSDKYHIAPKGIQSKATDLSLYCRQKGKTYKDYKAFLENALRKDKIKLQSEYPYLVAKTFVPAETSLSPEQVEANRIRIEAIKNGLVAKFKT